MPKLDKVKKKPSSRPQPKNKSSEDSQKKPQNKHKCCMCESEFNSQRGNFYYSQSPLYRGNNGYLPICQVCVNDIFSHYEETFGDQKEAMIRLCQKFDIYWNEELFSMAADPNKQRSDLPILKTYIARTNLYRYVGKTYDDSIDEGLINFENNEKKVKELECDIEEYKNSIDSYKSRLEEAIEKLNIRQDEDVIFLTDEDTEIEIPRNLVDFWGAGLEPPEIYFRLDKRYKKWTLNVTKELSSPEEAIYRQICILEETINRDMVSGKAIDKSVNSLNTILGSGNLKPSQNKVDDSDEDFEGMPLGVGIRVYENKKPILDEDPDFRDVDGIIRYISIWFFGHLCKMVGLKNSYSRMYEEEIAKLRLDNPEITEEDDNEFLAELFPGEQGDEDEA